MSAKGVVTRCFWKVRFSKVFQRVEERGNKLKESERNEGTLAVTSPLTDSLYISTVLKAGIRIIQNSAEDVSVEQSPSFLFMIEFKLSEQGEKQSVIFEYHDSGQFLKKNGIGKTYLDLIYPIQREAEKKESDSQSEDVVKTFAENVLALLKESGKRVVLVKDVCGDEFIDSCLYVAALILTSERIRSEKSLTLAFIEFTQLACDPTLDRLEHMFSRDKPTLVFPARGGADKITRVESSLMCKRIEELLQLDAKMDFDLFIKDLKTLHEFDSQTIREVIALKDFGTIKTFDLLSVIEEDFIKREVYVRSFRYELVTQVFRTPANSTSHLRKLTWKSEEDSQFSIAEMFDDAE